MSHLAAEALWMLMHSIKIGYYHSSTLLLTLDVFYKSIGSFEATSEALPLMLGVGIPLLDKTDELNAIIHVFICIFSLTQALKTF